MKINKTEIEIAQEIERLLTELTKDVEAIPEDRSGFYVFISYDLVNSTKYKSIDDRGWHELIYIFYKTAQQFFEKRQSGAKIWKFVGDEVLLYVPISCISELAPSITDAYDGLRGILDELQSSQSHQKYKSHIKIKGAVWGAYCHFDKGEGKFLEDDSINNQ